MKSTENKKGVLLLAFGTVDDLDNMEAFLGNVIKGRPVTPELVESAKERYRAVGGRSPLLDITRAQARALGEALKEGGEGWTVYVGMRYWEPYIKEAVHNIWADGIEEAVAVIMAPHPSRASTGGYEYDVEAAVKKTAGIPQVTYIGDWHTNPALIDTIAENMSDAASGPHSKGLPGGDDLLTIFTAHSLPAATLSGDSYVDKLNETVKAVVNKAAVGDHRLAYQSKGGGPGEWLGPAAEDVIREAAGEGKKGILVVPIGFCSDHVETLYDIDISMKAIAEEEGLAFARAASINTSPKFIEMLAELVRGAGA